MIELKLRLILVAAAWACFSQWAQCSNAKPDNALDECKRQCRDSVTPTENPTEVNSEVSIFNFTFRSCFAFK